MKKSLLIILILIAPILLFSQSKNEKKELIAKSNSRNLKSIAKKNDKLFKEKKKRVLDLAKINNWPQTIFKDSVFSELVSISENNKPIYYSTYNKGAGITSRANKLYTGGGLGLNINGENMTAGVWDAGSGMPTHQLFSGRLQLMDNSPQTHFHSAHVMGTIIGSELFQNGNAKGMAYKANGLSYDWNNDKSEVATAAANGLLMSNHSYGRSPYSVTTYEWGKYDESAQSFDEIMYNAPFYQFVCAAGNSRGGGFNTSKNSYDLLTGHATSKNGITVAAVNEVTNYTGSSSVQMSSFSSWGPTDDGRIKPDISAKGVNVLSAVTTSTSSYGSLSGTSMASPSVAGTLLLFQQYYKELNNSYMKASTLKGLMIHTADEAGEAPGPDYSFGWGLINAEKAADIITKNQLQSFILENTLNQNDTFTISVNALGTEPLIATLCWTDPKGNIPSSTTDDPTPSLINNLDLKITQNTTNHLPWKLNPANSSNPATQGENNVDTVEKVEVNNPSGSYLITVNNKGNLLNNLQNYSLIISGVTARNFWVISSEFSKTICSDIATINYNFELKRKDDFNETVTFSTLNLPSGIEASFSPATSNVAGNFSMTLAKLTSLLPGKYTFLVRSESPSDVYENEVTLTILSPIVENSVLQEPANNANSVELPVSFEWSANPNAQEYNIQIASDANFNTIIQESTVFQNKFTSSILTNNFKYFWRVRAKNTCNTGEFSDSFNLTTVCGLPTNVLVQNITQITAGFSWIENSNITSWEIQIVPQGTSPSATGVVVLSNLYNASGLNKNSCYDFYIKSYCGTDTTSGWIKKSTFCTLPDFCAGDHFYDTGGASGNYQNSENYIKTISPDSAGDRIKAVFNSFSTESDYDYLSIYNGPNTSYPLLFRGSGSASPGTLRSSHSSGSLTFSFYSDEIVAGSGWDATIICEPKPDCPDENISFSTISKTTNSAIISWASSLGISQWEVKIVPQGTTPTGNGILIPTNTYTLTGLTSNTWYDFYVRSKCSNGFSSWSNPYTFNTNPNYCAGDHFYDTGGPNGNYPSYEYKIVTINPTTAGDRVKAIFNLFQLNTYDSFAIYNGTSSNAELLYSNNLNTTSPPTTIVATNPQGALTFYFQSSNQTNAGWDATIVCEPLPPCSIKPSTINLVSKTSASATIAWTEGNFNATSWEIEVVPKGTTPTRVGVITSSKPYIASGLIANSEYDFYLRSVCGSQNSNWTTAFTFKTDVNFCLAGRFYDTGGANGNYQNSENYIKTITPDSAGNRIKAVFNYIDMESCCDYLSIYNGPNTSSPLLFRGSGSTNPGTLRSSHSSGSLTFSFYSDGSATGSGWDANIICEPFPNCPDENITFSTISKTTNSAIISWSNSLGTSQWEVKIVPQGTIPTGNGALVSSNTYTLTGLTSNIWYDFYVRSKCSNGFSSWSSPYTFNTNPNYCAGDHFYDTGGPNGNYPSYENRIVTINPSTSGDRVKAIFNSFQLGNNDAFYVYNGTSTNAELLYSKNSNNSVSPATITATNTQGALTFYFYSSNQSSAGWDATIVCEPLPPCANKPSNASIANITKTSATFNWVENSNASSWEVAIVPQGTLPTTGISITTKPYLATGLTSNTWYSFYVRSKCGTTNSDWSQVLNFVTEADHCAGDHFYDTGGPNGNYPSYDYKYVTINPTTAGDRVKAIFNSFQLNTYDSFSVYNGTSSNAELLYSKNSNTTIPPTTITATNPQGALTFYFYASSQTNAGWDATIVCEPLPACSLNPSAINLISKTTTSATIAWTENSNATSWEIEVVPKGTTPTRVGVISSSKPYIASGLIANSEYDFYLRSVCGSQNSGWTTAFTFKTEENYCLSGRFYDSGGANGYYQNNESYTKTISPNSAGNKIKAVFSYIDLENCCDRLLIYNGPVATNSQLLFSSNGSILPGVLISTHVSGALTFVFTSDSSVTYRGWDATIVCEPVPPNCANKPSNASITNITKTSATFNWTENANTSSWEVTIVPQGTLPTTGISVATKPYLATGLTSNTGYSFYVRSKCGTTNSDWSQVLNFKTYPDYCAGDHFYDTGGPNGNYPIYESKTVTINPSTSGDRVKAIFNTFQLGTFDTFDVYNGTNTDSQLLYFKNSSNSVSPTTITAINPQGALTFRFSSSNQSNAGWDATIVCEPLPPCANKPSEVYLAQISTNSAIFNWTENFNANSWEVAIVPQGTLPSTGITIDTKPYLATGLTSNTWYSFYIRSKCSDGNSEWSQAINFNTIADYCAGDHFYDNGGPNGNYPSEDYSFTIYPTTEGDRVKAIFNSFQLNSDDTFEIYNGDSSYSELLYSNYSSNSVSPTTIAATNLQGALTFYFYASNQSNPGWDATIVCEPLPPCAIKPSEVYLDEISTNSATFYWNENSNASSWEIAIVPQGTLPSTGITVDTNPYLATGLTANTWYSFYVKSKCSVGNSDWTQALNFNTYADYCVGDHFYDNGGPNGNYLSDDYNYVTIYPKSEGDRVKAIFNTFQLNSDDTFEIYNGDSSDAELLYSNYPSNSVFPTTIAATNPQGALTFQFWGSSQSNAGWDATIVCEPLPPCANKPVELYFDEITTSSAAFYWTENSNADSWEVAIVPQGTLPTTGIKVSTNPYTASGLTSNTWYDFYVRSKCATANSEWSAVLPFNTEANYCAGDHFYDTGGPNSNYPNYEYKFVTIHPNDSGDYVQAFFNYIDLESCCDQLSVYNGPYINSPLLFSSNGSVLPGVLKSTHASGALSFLFNSNSSVTSRGWDATINCSTLGISEQNKTSNTIEYYPNPVIDFLNIKSTTLIKKINLYDINMRLILFEKVDSSQFKINLSRLPEGVYFAILIDEENDYKQIKFIKNN